MYSSRHLRRLRAKFLVQAAAATVGDPQAMTIDPDLCADGELVELASASLPDCTARDPDCLPDDDPELQDILGDDDDDIGLWEVDSSDDEESDFVDDDEGGKEVEEFLKGLRLWVIQSGQTIAATNDLLKLLNTLRVIKGIPKMHSTLMSTPKTPVVLRDVRPGNYVHLGIQKHFSQLEDPSVISRSVIEIDVGIDGAPLAKSSSLSTWPILGYLCNSNLPVFDIGIYVGKSKPASCCDFLKDFAEEKEKLEKNGIFVSSANILKPFKIRVICADAPARAYVANVRYYNHKKGCNQCDQTCVSLGRRRVYQKTLGNLRTDQSFKDRLDTEHHATKFQSKDNKSVLEEAGFGLVSMLPIDPMHNLDQGVGKLILNALFDRSIKGGPKTQLELAHVKGLYANYYKCIPSEFSRKPRSLDEAPRYKATEVRQFCLYSGVVLLKSALDKEAFTHYLSFAMPYRLLSTECHPNNLLIVTNLLSNFVEKYDHFYENDVTRYNVHCLLHLPHHVQQLGPLSTFSCYKFEDRIRQLKRMVKSNNHVHQQLFNRIAERNAIGYRPATRPRNMYIIQANLRNGCFLLRDRSVVEIVDVSEDRTELTVVEYQVVVDFFTEPLKSGDLGIYRVSDLGHTRCIIDSRDILFKLVRLPYENDHVVQPLIVENIIMEQVPPPLISIFAASATTSIEKGTVIAPSASAHHQNTAVSTASTGRKKLNDEERDELLINLSREVCAIQTDVTLLKTDLADLHVKNKEDRQINATNQVLLLKICAELGIGEDRRPKFPVKSVTIFDSMEEKMESDEIFLRQVKKRMKLGKADKKKWLQKNLGFEVLNLFTTSPRHTKNNGIKDRKLRLISSSTFFNSCFDTWADENYEEKAHVELIASLLTKLRNKENSAVHRRKKSIAVQNDPVV